MWFTWHNILWLIIQLVWAGMIALVWFERKSVRAQKYRYEAMCALLGVNDITGNWIGSHHMIANDKLTLRLSNALLEIRSTNATTIQLDLKDL